MHSPCKRPTSTYDYVLGVLSTITVPLVATRVIVATGAVTITNQLANAGTSIATVVFMAGTFGLAWRRTVLRNRADRAELEQRIDELEKRVAETENAAWWGTPPVEAEPERTVEPGRTVVPFPHRKSS